MHKRYFRIVLTAVLFVGMVAVGVHALNKRALAQNVTFELMMHDDGNGVEGLSLHLHWLDSQQRLLGGNLFDVELGDGVYRAVIENLPSNAVYWEVSMEGNQGYIPENPAEWQWVVGEIAWDALNTTPWEIVPD